MNGRDHIHLFSDGIDPVRVRTRSQTPPSHPVQLHFKSNNREINEIRRRGLIVPPEIVVPAVDGYSSAGAFLIIMDAMRFKDVATVTAFNFVRINFMSIFPHIKSSVAN